MSSARADALLAQIHAHPDDDALRLVYADVLIEEGDPRGEFIQLQLLPTRDAAQRARIEELLVAHRSEWLGGLAGALHSEACVFERGFLSVAKLQGWGQVSPAVVGEPAWATVRAIEPYPSTGWSGVARALVTDPGLRALEAVQLLPEETFLALCRGEGSARVSSLGVRGPETDRDRFALGLARVARGFPRLRRLTLATFVPRGHDGLLVQDADAETGWFAPLLAAAPPPIERIGVSCGVHHFAAWMSAVERTRFVAFDLDHLGGWSVRLTLRRASSDVPFRDVELTMPSTWPRVSNLTAHVQVALATVPPEAIERFTVVLSDDGVLAPARRKLVEAAIARFPRAETSLPWKKVVPRKK